MTNSKKIVLSAMFISIGVILPICFHSIPGAGGVLLPMHIPVLMCGLLLGAPYGLICGILTPLLSSLLTGMPPMAVLPGMMIELAVYGSVSGLTSHFLKIDNELLRLYAALLSAMLLGRIAGGAVNALIFRAGDYSMQIWMSTYFVTGLPGIVIQLGAIPSIVATMRKAKLVALPG